MDKSIVHRSIDRVGGWVAWVHPAAPWLLAGAGATAVWLTINSLFWLDVSRMVGRAADPGDIVGLLLFAGLPFLLIGVGSGFVVYAGVRSIRQGFSRRRLLLGLLEVLLGALLWLAAALAAFLWIGVIAVG